MDVPETRFARVGEDRIAYQVFGEGPVDLLWIVGAFETLDGRWEWPPYAHFLRRVGSYSRVISFDRRGSGASDRASSGGLPVWEDWADDARAVLDAVESERAAVYASTDAGPIGLLLAATEPVRIQALVLYCTTARFMAADDYPEGLSEEMIAGAWAYITEMWGTEALAEFTSRTAAQDPAYRRWFAKMSRAVSTPRDILPMMHAITEADVRAILPTVQAPTLIIHRTEFALTPLEHGRYLAEHLPNARLVVIPGEETIPFVEPGVEETLREMETFLTGTPVHQTDSDRVLAAVLYTDIVGSTDRAASIGDRSWKVLLDSHDAIARSVVEQCEGRLVKLTGDGVLATFDGPGRAIRCAQLLRDALGTLAINIRAGVHTGEIERRGDDIGGVGVHVASRVMDHARSGEILVSGAVPLLMVGSNTEFETRGERALKGIPGEWSIFAVKN